MELYLCRVLEVKHDNEYVQRIDICPHKELRENKVTVRGFKFWIWIQMGFEFLKDKNV